MAEEIASEYIEKVTANDKTFKYENSGYFTDSWQVKKSTIQERFSFLFLNCLMSDVSFVVGKDNEVTKIPAHKLVLAAGSNVFYKMFYGPLQEKHNEIKVIDIGKEAFLCLLSYLYCDKVDLNLNIVMPVIHAADKYEVLPLAEQCWNFVKQNVDCKTVFYVLHYADLYENLELRDLCFNIIDDCPSECFHSDYFTDIELNTLCSVLDRSSLKIKEVDVFKAVLKWAKAECMRRNFSQTPQNLKEVAGKAIKLVRFPLMTTDEFSSHVPQSGLLADEDLLELYHYLTVLPKPAVKFSTVERALKDGVNKSGPSSSTRTSKFGYTQQF